MNVTSQESQQRVIGDEDNTGMRHNKSGKARFQAWELQKKAAVF